MQSQPAFPQLDKAECERHLRGLNSYKRQIREASLRQIAALPPEHLLQLMREGARLYRRRYRLSSNVELLSLVACIPVGMLLFLVAGVGEKPIGVLCLLIVCFAVGWHIFMVPWRMYRALVGVLEHTEDLNLIGPIISMYVRPDGIGQKRVVLGNTLARLLPRLRFDHAGLLTVEQKQDMLRLLPINMDSKDEAERAVDWNMALQALKALEQIGDESAIPAVQRLTSYIFNQNTMVQQAAEQCLKHLRSNTGRHKEMQTLLRASAVAEVAPGMLLRPADGHAATPPEQLLRPQS